MAVILKKFGTSKLFLFRHFSREVFFSNYCNHNFLKCRNAFSLNCCFSTINRSMLKTLPPVASNYTFYDTKKYNIIPSHNYCTAKKEHSINSSEKSNKPPSLLQRFKQMYRDYWYVLVPVHLVTSSFWFCTFYYLAKSGVDIASLLESIGAGEKLVEKLRNGNSTMGYIAIAYALYKIATPIRYTVTLGGTTISIKYLKDWGYIKPIPPKDKIKNLFNERKEVILETKQSFNKLMEREKKALLKEKDAFFKDEKGFYRYIHPKWVKTEKNKEEKKKK